MFCSPRDDENEGYSIRVYYGGHFSKEMEVYSTRILYIMIGVAYNLLFNFFAWYC